MALLTRKGLCFARKATRPGHELQLFLKTGTLSRKGKRRDDSLRSAILDDGFMEDGHFCQQFTTQSATKTLSINRIDVIAFVLSKTFGSRSYCKNKWSER